LRFRGSSAPFPKFVIRRSTLSRELRKQRGTSNSMILVPLFDLKFLTEFAAGDVGTFKSAALAHDPEKWKPVFGKDHAQTKG
jgi:hypothetical protein